MTLEIVQAAEEEADAAVLWYDAQRRGLGSELLTELYAVLARIESAPESFSLVEDDVGGRQLRFGMLGRFPYKVVFELKTNDYLLVLAVAHLSRHPGYWRDRI